MGTPPYVELHSHSCYSFLDGTSRPDELVERALALGHRALGLTDHDSLSGAMELAMAAKETADFKPIFGAEITVLGDLGGRKELGEGRDLGERRRRGERFDSHRHITLLVRDGRGWSNLCRLITLAHGRTRGNRPRSRAAGQPVVTLEEVQDHAEGLVCLSGCATAGVHEEAGMRQLLEAFGADSLRIELQRPYARHDRARNRMLERVGRRLGVAAVATGDVHAHSPERALLQDAFVALGHGMALDGSDLVRRPNHTHVMARPEAMASRFADHHDAVAESVRLAESLEFDLTRDLGYRYPGAEGPGDPGGSGGPGRSGGPGGMGGPGGARRPEDPRDPGSGGAGSATGRALAEVCWAAFGERYPRGSVNHCEAAARLEGELSTIEGLGLAGFFMLHHEIFRLAHEVAAEVRGAGSVRGVLAPGRGRGSSVSSIVCYLTGLSHIDPVANGLAMGRFLHEEIASLPDIDLDFPRDIREKLIPRIHEHYGHDRSALVAAFPTFRARGSIRELGKALGLPPGEIERVARCADAWGGGGAVEDAVATALGKGRARRGRWKWLVRLAEQARGLPRHISQHSGGMIISTKPLIDCCPVVPAAMEERQIAQWDKDSCADAGFLKIDLLGLGMLSAVERCVELIARRTGERVDLSRIPFDDERTFRCIQSADTTGVFQIESRAQMGSLRRTKPASLADLTVQVALVRPGPIVGGAVNPYIKRRRRLLEDPEWKVPHLHPSLEGPLEQTLGTIVFQDQVIEVAQAFAGFSPGRAEGLRRAMSRKRSAQAMEEHRKSFIEGAMATHPDVEKELAEQVWKMVAAFAGFGFPKAHGAAFGLLAYQSTWLRVHHSVEFLCALLNEQPMGFYAPDSLVHEAQRRGVRVRSPEVNRSEVECVPISAREVQIGLGYVKGLGEHDAREVVRSREEDGPFRSLENLARRAGVGRGALELLAWAGACDGLAGGGSMARRRALWQLGVAAPAREVAAGARGRGGRRREGVGGPGGGQVQLALELDLGDPPVLEPLGEWETMVADYQSTEISVSRHPLALLRSRLDGEGVLSSGGISRVGHGAAVKVAGLVIARQRPSTASGVTFLLLEDEQGTINVIVPPPLYERCRGAIRREPLLLVAGRLEMHADGAGAVNVVAKDLEGLLPGNSIDGDFKAVAPAVTSFAQGRRR